MENASKGTDIEYTRLHSYDLIKTRVVKQERDL